jgi:hypothetical protein
MTHERPEVAFVTLHKPRLQTIGGSVDTSPGRMYYVTIVKFVTSSFVTFLINFRSSDMVAFVDLPLELLPDIFDSVVSPPHLASLCLVNSSFNQFATQRLYQRIYCYAWHNNSKVDHHCDLILIMVVHIRVGRPSVSDTFKLSPSCTLCFTPW